MVIVVVFFALFDRMRDDIPSYFMKAFLPTLSGARPLSWHLTDAERAGIRLQWAAYEGHAEQIGRWLRGTPGDCPPPGT